MESKPNCQVALSRIPRYIIAVDENLCARIAMEKFNASETHSCFAAMYR